MPSTMPLNSICDECKRVGILNAYKIFLKYGVPEHDQVKVKEELRKWFFRDVSRGN